MAGADPPSRLAANDPAHLLLVSSWSPDEARCLESWDDVMAMDRLRGRAGGWATRFLPMRFLPGRALSAAVGGAAESGDPAGLALTEDLPDMSSCPACGRPLEVSTGVCAGCGTRLVIGVPARRAAVFVAFGLLVGLVVGSESVRLIAPPTGSNVVAAAGADGTGATGPAAPGLGASASAGPGPAASAIGGDSTPAPVASVPRDAMNALRQTEAIDLRLRATADELRRILAARPFDPAAAAQSLRDVASDASIGTQYLPGLAAWPAAAALRSDVAAFYDGVLAIARGGLSFSIADATAYRNATAAMVVRFRSLGAIDAAVHSLAVLAGIEPQPAAAPASSTAPAPATTAP